MKPYKKTAKDLAFDRKRFKYEKQIQDLRKELSEMEERALKAESKSEQLQDWVDRLLEYTEMSEEDLKKTIQREKTIKKFIRFVETSNYGPQSFF